MRSGALTDSGFRLDVQGLRGLALILVLACHAKLPWAEGGFIGLDVFYVLSGFLITGLLLAEVERTGRVSVLAFYARRARRLLPLAFTVLVVVLLGSLALFGPLRAYEVSRDVVAAALYVANWHFMAGAVDYFAFADPDISPVQHYWSLSVEEQFYLAWPVLIVALLPLARRFDWSPRRALWLVVAPVLVGSFAYGVWYSQVATQAAYFSTLTRIWQIALGCALALALPAGLRLARWASAALAGGGVTVLIWATITFRDEIPYPGWYALLPTVGAAAVIVAGTGARRSAPVALLCVAPLQYLGRISYAWYLWHWPVLVFAAAVWTDLSPLHNVALTLAAWFPAIVSHHLIEERFRHSRRLARRPRQAIAFGLSCTGAAVALALGLASLQTTVPVAAGSEVAGARAAERGLRVQERVRAIAPDPRRAEADRPKPFSDGCHLKNTRRTTSPRCEYGSSRATRTVVNLGDSHALQYFSPLERLARERGWRLLNLTRAGCTVADVSYTRDCSAWRRHAVARIEHLRPDAVYVHTGTALGYHVDTADGRKLKGAAAHGPLRDGLARTLRRFQAAGATVVVVRDHTQAPARVVECVAESFERLSRCAFRSTRTVGAAAFDLRAAKLVGAKLLDPQRRMCDDGRCPAVIGDALVYRNGYHITDVFARSLAPWFEHRLPRSLQR